MCTIAYDLCLILKDFVHLLSHLMTIKAILGSKMQKCKQLMVLENVFYC